MLAGAAARSHLAVVGVPAVDDGTYEVSCGRRRRRCSATGRVFVGPVTEVPAVLRSLDVLLNVFGVGAVRAERPGGTGLRGTRDRD